MSSVVMPWRYGVASSTRVDGVYHLLWPVSNKTLCSWRPRGGWADIARAGTPIGTNDICRRCKERAGWLKDE